MARYDAIADWYEHDFMASSLAAVPRETALRLLGGGSGRLLDVGCGTGVYSAAFAEAGWSLVGVDLSTAMLRFARERGLEVVEADAADLPFDDGSFDAAVSIFTHTDVDNFSAVLREVSRVVRPNGLFVYVGAHPCFVGPHSRFVEAEGVTMLHPTRVTVTSAATKTGPGFRRKDYARRSARPTSRSDSFSRPSSVPASSSSGSRSRDERTYPCAVGLRLRNGSRA